MKLIAFTELVNKAFLVGGSTPQEQKAAMYQLTQAMASGRLQANECVLFAESAPLLKKLYKIIWDLMMQLLRSNKKWGNNC